MHIGAWAVKLYEPELLSAAEARTTISYGGKSQNVINLCSYNYLGLANRAEVIDAAHAALKTHGLGACGSPMLSGMTDLHRELERKLAEFLGREDAMLFNSGFGGALGTISGLLRKTDVALLDNRSHLSLRDGATLSRCRTEKFEHNDPDSLDAALKRQSGKRQLVIVEGIYSMDGDFGNLEDLLDVSERHGASVFIDEAHSILACGEHGRGAAEKFEVEDRVRGGRAPVRRPRLKKGMGQAPEVRRIEDALRRRLGTDVRVTLRAKGKGQIHLNFYSNDDLARLLELILGEPFDG
jgi:glycine C-acetyltransferase